ncbi:MAG: tyrosine-type recombinase/integrase [Candidatus Heimdallarchaeaceae archaeon]
MCPRHSVEFTLDEIQRMINFYKSKDYDWRKIKELFGVSPNTFLKIIKQNEIKIRKKGQITFKVTRKHKFSFRNVELRKTAKMIGNFSDSLLFEKKLSKNTVNNYQLDLCAFFRYVKIGYQSIKSVHIQDYLRYLSKRGYAQSSIRRKLMSLKSFYKFLEKKGELDENPTKIIASSKQERQPPSFVSKEKIDEMLLVGKKRDPQYERNKQIILFLFNTGVKVSELVRMKVSDIQGDGSIRIKEKENKERITIYVDHKQFLDFKRFISKNSTKYIFETKNNQPISISQVQRVVKKYGLYICRNNLSPNILRHSFATFLLQKGMELKYIQVLLGHETLLSTKFYLDLTIQDVRQELEKIREI